METADKVREDIEALSTELERAYTEISDNHRQIIEIVAMITGRKNFAQRPGGQTALTAREALDFIAKSFTVMQKACQELRKAAKKEQATRERVSQTDLFRR